MISMQVQIDMDLPTLRRVRIGGVANASVTLFTMGAVCGGLSYLF